MGQVTLFVREDCPFCKRVLACLQESIAKVERESPEQVGKVTLKVVEAKGAMAALCVRLTGSLTVPHVFMQTEYLGDCSTTCALASNQNADCNLVLNKIRALARMPDPSPAFPPPPEAQMLKVTESMACSSLPTPEQLASLSTFGFRTVVDLIDVQESSYCKEEPGMLAAAGVGYVASPLDPGSEKSIRHALAAIRSAQKPVLVHCDTGVRAALVAVLAAAQEMDVARDATQDNIKAWGSQMGVDLGPFAGVASRAMAV